MFNPVDNLLREIEALKKKVQKLEDDQIKQNRDYKDMIYNLDTDNIPKLQAVVKKVNLVVSDGDNVTAEFVMEVVNNESNARIKADRINLKGATFNLTADNIDIKSTNFTVDENGNVTIKGDASVSGVLTAKSGSKLGPWIFDEDRINGIKTSTSRYLVQNPQDTSKMSAMNVTVGNFVLDGSHIGVTTTVTWDDEVAFTSDGVWSAMSLSEYLQTAIKYRKTTGWENTITWERLSALGELGSSSASVILDT